MLLLLSSFFVRRMLTLVLVTGKVLCRSAVAFPWGTSALFLARLFFWKCCKVMIVIGSLVALVTAFLLEERVLWICWCEQDSNSRNGKP